MQTHDSDDQRPTEELVDRRRDDERCTVQTPSGVVRPQGFNPADGTLCLGVTLTGSGKAAA